KAATARTWMKRVEAFPDFRFTAKLWRRFTHERKRAWTKAEVKEARAALDAMHRKDRLAAVVMQFPWSFRNDETGRQWLGDLITSFDGLPLVVEVRDSSWLENDFFQELLESGVGFV